MVRPLGCAAIAARWIATTWNELLSPELSPWRAKSTKFQATQAKSDLRIC